MSEVGPVHEAQPGIAPDTALEVVLLVRRPPGRGHLYRFARSRFTVGGDAACALCLQGPGIAAAHLVFERTADGYAIRAEAEASLNGRRLTPGERCPVRTADAIEVGDRLIEVALDHDPAPTTDRQDAGRLHLAQEAERRVREANGPSLWVLRGGGAGLAVPVDGAGVVCGSGPDDGLLLPDAGVCAGHFTVRADADGSVWLSARAPVRVRGRRVDEARLGPGDLVFVGDAVCELRAPAVAPPVGGPWWPVAALAAVAVALLGVAWWLELR